MSGPSGPALQSVVASFLYAPTRVPGCIVRVVHNVLLQPSFAEEPVGLVTVFVLLIVWEKSASGVLAGVPLSLASRVEASLLW